MRLLMPHAPLRTHGAAVYPYSEKLAERYTLESRFEDEFPLFIQQGSELWLPRRLAPSLGEDLRDPGLPYSFTHAFKPRNAEQARVVPDSVALLKMDVSHILQAPTGFGKTVVGVVVAAEIQRRFLVITTKQDLIDHWFQAGINILGLKPHQISLWRGDDAPDGNAPMVVGLVQSILKGPDRYGVGAYQGFGLVICDEVHRMGADQFTQAMWWLPARLRLGLSATPYRKDGKEIVFQSHIGEVQVIATQETLIPNVIIKHTKWKVPRVFDKKLGKLKQMPHKAGRTMHLMGSMATDIIRNVEIAKFVRVAYEKGRTTVVFADTMDHLKALRDSIIKSGVPLKDTGWYVGLSADVYEGNEKTRTKQREKAKIARVVFATYKMCSEGTDAPWWDTCVLGSPRGDVVQIVGRIRREYPDKKVPLVFDPVDADSAVFAGYARNRLNWYKSLGCKVNVHR